MNIQPIQQHRKMPYMTLESVNPTLAAQYLALNQNNRPVSSPQVSQYSEAMKRGEWRVNGESIAFADDGSLLNGQHRLHAIIRSGTTQQMLVMRGIDRDAFSTVDIGRKRQASDMLSIAGETNVASLAAACRYVHCIKAGGNFRSCTPTQIQQVLERHPTLRYWNGVFVTKKLARVATATLVAVVALGSEIHGQESGEFFMDKMATGSDLPAGSPILALRERLAEVKRRREYMSQLVSSFVTIRAWNAYVDGRKVQILRYSSNSEFPVIK